MLYFLTERVHLKIAHNHVLGFAVEGQFNQFGVERFFFNRIKHGFVIDSDCNRLLTFTIQHGGGLAFATQAAARTSALCFANGSLNFV